MQKGSGQTITIVGLGLIGGSIAESLSGVAGMSLYGVDTNPRTVMDAMVSGLFEDVYGSLGEGADALKNSDIVIVATAVGATYDTIARVYEIVGSGAIITDVASVKANLIGLSKRDGIRLVGGHPMAGTEKSGFGARVRGLFRGAKYIITPFATTCSGDLDTVVRLVLTLESKPMVMAADEHDTLVARCSHMPHIVAYALSDFVLRDSDPYIAGKGFLDMIRIASSSPEFWSDVSSLNRHKVVRELSGLIQSLDEYKNMIEGCDNNALVKRLRQSKQKRDEVIE